MRRLLVAFAMVGTCTLPAGAQVVVHDPAVTWRNALTAVTKEYLVELQRMQHSQLRRMAQRLSMFTSLVKYARPGAPLWRIHDFQDPNLFLFSRAYNAAMNYGDASGRAFDDVSQPLLPSAVALAALPPPARRTVSAYLATVEAASSAAIAATHDTGQVRLNGRRELAAIEALEYDVTDDRLDQSTTAVLDKISGAQLIAGRQRQARTQLLGALVEQLLIDTKRARDTDTAAMNMQLVAWRDRAAVNAAFVQGTGTALQAWRQP
ncbi:hypothetical protein [Luteitalea sp.]|uniref:hypothetical protein n=1 Tax=Luteitalea sp. TaxID=2004800 RepID=UPI0025B9364F|nr:hypothetical protein [Luteitalea sp.]